MDILRQPMVLAAAVGVAALVLWFLWRKARGKKSRTQTPPTPKIDLEALGETGPAAKASQLLAYNVPVRLALLIIAPAGREGLLPTDAAIAAIADRSVPGLSGVIESHGTQIQRWPAQLSASGFAHTMFSSARLPDAGRGTAWCCAAGPIVAQDKRFMMGLVMRSAAPNNLGQYTIERDTQWLDVLRVTAAG